jgi:hypothetical protein
VGLPHSDSCGSTLVDNSPHTIVAFHVLLRLLAPRYPPYALCSLTYIGSFVFLSLDYPFNTGLLSRATHY